MKVKFENLFAVTVAAVVVVVLTVAVDESKIGAVLFGLFGKEMRKIQKIQIVYKQIVAIV